ncbi:MAG: type II and III secretion system protein family protein [Terriglobales bacterium]
MKLRTCFAILPCAVAALALAQEPAVKAPPAGGSPRDLVLNVGKSLVLESPEDIQRVSVASGDILELVAVGPREIVLNGKSAGESSLILWQANGNRLMFDVSVRKPDLKQEALRRELAKELGEQSVSANVEGDAVYLRGTVRDLVSAQRAEAIAAPFGKPIDLLRVATPMGEPQILLKVKFAEVDRTITSDLGLNLFSTGATNTIGSVGTEAYSPPLLTVVPASAGAPATSTLTLADALNIFLFRPDLNLGATIKLLVARNLATILAEPNMLTSSGKAASFLNGGEFPFPVVQPSSGGIPTVSIQWREFGVKLNFTPFVTPRGTIRLVVAPEVSALDYTNDLVYSGFTIPALSTRKMSTEVELKDGQSFAIAGLLDNRVIETLDKIPGLGDIPFFGKLFQSRHREKEKTELLVIVTPEIVRPIPEGHPLPDLSMPTQPLKEGGSTPPRTPGIDVTGPVPVTPTKDSLPVEQLLHPESASQSAAAPAPPMYQLVPVQPTTPPATPPAAEPATTQTPPKQ